MKPTSEQQHAIDLFSAGEPIRAVAFAGAGKTSTLVAMAHANPDRTGLYVAYNKAIQMDAKAKFAGTRVTCLTAHSMAFRSILQQGFEENKLTGRAWSRDYKFYKQSNRNLFADIFQKTAFLSFVSSVIQRFCHSWDDEISMKHVPILPKQQDGKVRLRVTEEDRGPAMHCAREIWERMSSESDPLPMGHDGYVKLWALGRPQFFFDYFLADEAQDLNPVLIKVMLDQKDIAGVPVGDTHQQIYEWRGAKDALPMFPGQECHLTQSFRFGPTIASAADGLLKAMGEERTLRGIDVQDRICGEEAAWDFLDAVLCRSNAGVISAALAAGQAGRAVYVQGGVAPILELVNDVERLESGQEARTADLAPFMNWSSVVEFAETEEGGGFRTLVRLVKNYGVPELKKILGRILAIPSPETLTVSTTHKAKGLEWDFVRVENDFGAVIPDKDEDGEQKDIPLPDRRLFYVACTRAKRFLNVDEKMLEAFSVPYGKETE